MAVELELVVRHLQTTMLAQTEAVGLRGMTKRKRKPR